VVNGAVIAGAHAHLTVAADTHGLSGERERVLQVALADRQRGLRGVPLGLGGCKLGLQRLDLLVRHADLQRLHKVVARIDGVRAGGA